MIEGAEIGRQRLGEVVDDRPQAITGGVEGRVAGGEGRQLRLQFDADDAAIRHARGETEADRADAGAEIEDMLARPCIHGGGQQHRIHGNTITSCWLQ